MGDVRILKYVHMALVSLQNLSLSFGAGPLLDAVDLQLERGERVCLLGRNGAGKSSLLKIIGGDLAPDSGEVVFQKGVTVGRLPQEVPQDVSGTVRQVVGGDSGAPDHEVEAVISRLKLEPDVDFNTLSGGLKRRAWLGRILVGQPDVLLLDEPTNHLDIDSITWLEEFLLRHVRTLLFITHDRSFLQRLATRIVEVDRGQLFSWECNYDTYLERKAASLEAEAKQQALFDKRLAQEEAWIRRGVEARRTKSQSRINALFEMRAQRLERRNRVGSVHVKAQEAQKSGRLVVEAENVGFSYEGKPILSDFSTLIVRGDKIGIIGPNGSGKTTLLKLLLGQLEPQEGTIELGTRLQIAYFDQLRAQLDDDLSVQQNVCGENSTVHINGESRHIVGYLQDFLFSPERARTPVRLLSGGERNRLLLAKLFTQPANVLVMDEPTNDLDVETLEVLENLLVDFDGTLLLVSHDRAFLNNVVTSSFVFEPDTNGGFNLQEYVGGYDDWLRQRPATSVPAEAKPAANVKPKAISEPKPRKLSFKETRELEELPARIEKLEAEQQRLAEQMTDPAFFADQGQRAAQTTARLSAIEDELLHAFTRWEELLEIEKQAAKK